MRIMTIGNKPVIKRLNTALDGSDIELICPSDLFEAIAMLNQDKFDLVMMDSLTEEAEDILRHINEVGSIPVVLMIERKQQDWKKMQSLNVDGYILQEVNVAELIARLRAVSRRFRPANKAAGGNLNRTLAPVL